jgi:hypothetical protein
MSRTFYITFCKGRFTFRKANKTFQESQMNKQNLTLNAGTGMVAGVIIAAIIALLVSATTGDQSIWSWAIPVGLATGLAIGAGRQQQSKGA